MFNFLGNRFVLVTTPSHASIPPNQNGTLVKDGFSESGKCIRKVTSLRMQLRGGVRVPSGLAALCLCMRPPRRDECPRTSHWPAGCDSVTSQDAFEYAGTKRDE